MGTGPLKSPLRRVCAFRFVGLRPDIAAALGELSKVQSNPGKVHVERLDHLMRYVNTTAHHGLLYGGRKKSTADAVLVG